MTDIKSISLNPQAVREDFPILAQTIHRDRPLIYFDNASSSQRPRQVVEAMTAFYEHAYANVHRGTHWLSEQASHQYEQARLSVQNFINAQWTNEIVFTSNATAAINTVARSWGDANVSAGDEILLTMMEHHSNIIPWHQLAERTGARVRFAAITSDGRLDLDDFERQLSDRTKVVGIAGISNTLGTINPLKPITELGHAAGAVVVVDAAQHAPHEPIDVQEWNADFVAFSGHKMLGPSGIGVLYGRQDWLESMPPFLGGGSMIKTVTVDGFTPGDLPAKFEAGTPPIAEAVGLAAAIDYLSAIGLESIARHERQLAAHAQLQLREIEGLRILGPSAEHTCGIVSFVVDGVSAQDISVLVDLRGVAVRAGHHCTMPLHEHLGIAASCRASFYIYNTADEIDVFVTALNDILPKLR